VNALVDTCVLLAAFNERDSDHKKAVDLAERIAQREFGTVYYTDYVFDELMNIITVRISRKKALDHGKKLLESELQLIHVDAALFEKAWHIFQKTTGLSFTDCTTLATANEKKAGIISFDSGFKRIKGVEVIDA